MLAVLHVLGLMLALFASAYLLPIACALIMRDGTAIEFVIAAAVNLAVGLSLALAFRRFRRELKPRDGFLLVSLIWVLMSAAATIPLMLHLPDLSFTDAFFETMSGFTTTGSTVLSGLDTLAPSMNLWRCTLHWLGGIGIIVLAVAVLPLLGVGGMQIYKAEVPGAVKDEKLTPRITQTAKALWFTYAAITAVCVVALKVSGMSWFDAICHAFSVMSLGGFSTHDASIGWFDSPLIEAVLIVFMLIASLNFARHFLALRRLTIDPYRQDPEVRANWMLFGTSIAAVTLVLIANGTYPEWHESLRHAAFTVVSIGSTTGFVTADYEKWPVFAPIWVLFLSCLVCCTGSTGGGIKMFRTLLLSRQATREMKLLVHPSAVLPIRVGGQLVPERVVNSVLAFIFLYCGTIAALTFALLLTGLDVVSALSGVIASVNNMGPGLGKAGPMTNYGSFTDLQTWIFSIAMLLGRLEIFSVLVLFTATFWRR